jgi:hypothetical protein
MENGNLIHQKMFDFQTKVQAIKKDAKNPHFKNTYASLNQILGEVKPLLTEVGLALIQPIQDNKVTTIIVCKESGESMHSAIELPTGLTPQQIGSAITYYRRYTISGLLSLETEDDDGQGASQPAKTSPPAQKFEKEIMEIQKGTSEHELKQIWAGLSKEAQASQECIEAANQAYAKIKK